MITYNSYNHIERFSNLKEYREYLCLLTSLNRFNTEYKKNLIELYTNKLFPFSTVPTIFPLNDISKIRKELDLLVTVHQSVELLELYLIAEKKETEINNGKLLK
ncbi:hypothetical protein M0P65_05405 [Candidatus Gracilibacteria bacterium]|nr:hypothetical protein [Candidatus Gracilibacteria bacterium]